MTELQKKELQLLKCFLNITDQLDLRYYLVCGSALGAVKYAGFIPWDDDVDVAMPRPDYERFLEKAPQMLPDWVFLQNYRTDPEYPGLGSKLRDVNTTFIEKEASKIKMNHGVFIDVFPLDGYPAERSEQRKFEKKKWSYYRKRYTALIPVLHRDIGLTFLSILRQCFGIYTASADACRQAENLAKHWNVEESELWCNFANSMHKSEYAPRAQYGKGTWAVFEGMNVRIPELYDEYLTQKYGDWRADLPEEKQQGHHYCSKIDLENPYTVYTSF